MAVVGARGGIRGVGLRKVHLDEGVDRAKSALESVSDEEEAVGASKDGLAEGVGRRWEIKRRIRFGSGGNVGVSGRRGRSVGGWRSGSREVLQGGGGKKGLRGGRRAGLMTGVKECVIVGVAAEGPTDRDGKLGNVKVEEALVGPVRWSTGPKRRWARGEARSMRGERFGRRIVAEVAKGVLPVGG